MRNIYDILEELRNHPDCVCIDVWTRDMVIDHLVSHFENDLLYDNPKLIDVDINLEIDDLNENDWWEINHQLERNYEFIGEPIRLDMIDGLEKRLRRKINLDNLLKKR